MHKKSEKLTQDLQAQFLSKLCRERALVCIYLTKGTRLEGYIKAFDEYILYLDEPCQQIVYKSSICSISPMSEKKSAHTAIERSTEEENLNI
jgi:RNA chaperone Hfq